MSDIFGAASPFSALPFAVGSTFGPIVDDLADGFALIGSNQRSIGDLFPDAAIEEIHHDVTQITRHPVEVGSPVSDHAYDDPPDVELRWGWSDSSAASVGFSVVIYQALLAMKQSKQLINVSTGKRAYTNMLIRSLSVKTDETSEFALMVVATCEQLFLTSTETTDSSQNTDGNSPAATLSPDGNFNSQGGVAPTSQGDITAPSLGAGGNYLTSNSPFSGGTISLQPAPAGTPTVESLTANQGV